MKFTGTGVALITPFDREGKIDESALRKLVKHQIANGTDFLVVLGTTGESATLSQAEQHEVLSIVIDENQKKLPIVLGMGGNNTAELSKEMAAFDNPDVDAFLSASPHYNKPTQQGIIEHFKALAKVSTRPIILYNVPGRTASNMTADTTIELSHVDNIIAVKEASGDINQVMQIIDKANQDFIVLSGEDALTMPIVALGGHGVISVVANAFPNEFSHMIQATKENNLDKARSKHYQLLDLINLLFAEGNPAGIKYCLKQLNICENVLRLPLVPISSQLEKRLQEEIQIKKLN
jgi:4-hydroxy-tetrahydrodipicolinate synthase